MEGALPEEEEITGFVEDWFYCCDCPGYPRHPTRKKVWDVGDRWPVWLCKKHLHKFFDREGKLNLDKR
jgi:hypothetical protein